MRRNVALLLGITFATVAISGCAESHSETPVQVTSISSEHLKLTSEPIGAIEVLDARENAKDGESIVIVGRLGGGIAPWIEGRAAFLLVDTRILPSCAEGDHCEEGCADCSKEMLAASTMVKFFDGDGKVIPIDARTFLGLKEHETVVIKGKAMRDKTGNVSIAAEGIFTRR